jgi:hypothetical protein
MVRSDGAWNYRLMKRAGKNDWFAVVEVYYRKDGSIRAWTENGVGPCGESAEEAARDYALMAEAFVQPVLDEQVLLDERKGRKGGKDGKLL